MDACKPKICFRHGLLDPLNVDKYRRCRICTRERTRAIYAANTRYILDRNKASLQRNKLRIEKLKKYKQTYRIQNKEKISEHKKEYRALNKEKLKVKKNEWYRSNLDKLSKQRRNRYKFNPIRERDLNRVYIALHREQVRGAAKRYRAKNKEQIAKNKRARVLDLRMKALIHYSGGTPQCSMCHIDKISMLCFDHINNDGAKQRREMHNGNIHEYLRKNNHPEGFRVLCWNCNFLERLRLNPPNPKNHAAIAYRAKLKQLVMDHYSNGPAKCAICNISDIRILTIDHLAGSGKRHRVGIGAEKSGSKFYKWLRDNNFPPGFRVLCFNHNCSKS